jgi:hypothetical protein
VIATGPPNGKYSEFQGTIQGERMNGTGKNAVGKTWNWSAVRQ